MINFSFALILMFLFPKFFSKMFRISWSSSFLATEHIPLGHRRTHTLIDQLDGFPGLWKPMLTLCFFLSITSIILSIDIIQHSGSKHYPTSLLPQFQMFRTAYALILQMCFIVLFAFLTLYTLIPLSMNPTFTWTLQVQELTLEKHPSYHTHTHIHTHACIKLDVVNLTFKWVKQFLRCAILANLLCKCYDEHNRIN